jgi:hypothetical protein
MTKHKDILFIAEVRGDGGNTTIYNSTSPESDTVDIVALGVSLVVLVVCLPVLVFKFYTSKEIFFTTLS